MKKLFSMLALLVAMVMSLPANAAVYMIGEVNNGSWDPNGGVEMKATSSNVYTATVVINGYFSFCTEMGSWDKVNGSRFCPTASNGLLSGTTGETSYQIQKGNNGDSWHFDSTPTTKVVVTVNTSTKKISWAPEVVDPGHEPVITYAIHGNWSSDDRWSEKALTEKNGLWTIENLVISGDKGEFGIRKYTDGIATWHWMAKAGTNPANINASGNYTFLVSNNGNGANPNIAAGTYDFSYDPQTLVLTVTKKEGAVTPPTPTTTYTIYFEKPNDWSAVWAYMWGGELTSPVNKEITEKNADGKYVVTTDKKPENVIFKSSNGWDNQTKDYKFTNGNLYKAGQSTGYTGEAYTPGQGGQVTPPTPTKKYVGLAGTFTQWEKNPMQVEIEEGKNLYEFEVENWDATWEFQFIVDGTWYGRDGDSLVLENGVWPDNNKLVNGYENNIKLNAAAAGKTVTLTFALDTYNCKADWESGSTGPVTPPTPGKEYVELRGDYNGWDSDKSLKAEVKDGEYTVEFTVPNWKKEWGFKIYWNNTWYGKTDLVLKDGEWPDFGGLGLSTEEGEGNVKLDASADGKNVTITFALDTCNCMATWTAGGVVEPAGKTYEILHYYNGGEPEVIAMHANEEYDGAPTASVTAEEEGLNTYVIVEKENGEAVKYYSATVNGAWVEGTVLQVAAYDTLEEAEAKAFGLNAGNVYTIIFNVEGSYITVVGADVMFFFGESVVPATATDNGYELTVENWAEETQFMIVWQSEGMQYMLGANVAEDEKGEDSAYELQNGVTCNAIGTMDMEEDGFVVMPFTLPASATGNTVKLVTDLKSIVATWEEGTVTPVGDVVYLYTSSNAYASPVAQAVVGASRENCAVITVDAWEAGASFQLVYKDAWYCPYTELFELENDATEWYGCAQDIYGHNFTLPASANGQKVTITFAVDNANLHVKWNAGSGQVTYPAQLYLVMNDGNDNWDLTKGTAASGNDGVYVWENQKFGNVSNVYFMITTKLASKADGWDEIGTRYGSNTKELKIQNKTDELVAGSENCWLVNDSANNKYRVTVDLKNNTIKVDETTGVADLDAEDLYGVVYNAAGMVVARDVKSLNGLAKGLYIINGKKVLVK